MIEEKAFGNDRTGSPVKLYQLSNQYGMKAEITNYCGIIKKLIIPTKDGKEVDVVLGYDTLQQYLGDEAFHGAIVGRYANRIGGGSFKLNGKQYDLAAGDDDVTLHSGPAGMNDAIWSSRSEITHTESQLVLSYRSPHLDQGFPGNIEVSVIYALAHDKNQLSVRYHATTDQDTYLNLTNHSYFNLSGHNSGTILDESLQINADAYTPTDAKQLPTGEIAAVKNTPFDFTLAKPIIRDFFADNPQLNIAQGFDQNFVLNKKPGHRLSHAIEARSSKTGITLDLFTTKPGVQFYGGIFLDQKGKGQASYSKYTGYALETQYFPNSIHHPNFPSTLVTTAQPYNEETIYHFN